MEVKKFMQILMIWVFIKMRILTEVSFRIDVGDDIICDHKWVRNYIICRLGFRILLTKFLISNSLYFSGKKN